MVIFFFTDLYIEDNMAKASDQIIKRLSVIEQLDYELLAKPYLCEEV